MSIGTLTDGMQLVTLENNRFDSREKSETFALSRLFGLENFRYKKQTPKY